jgi:hypothetical protein
LYKLAQLVEDRAALRFAKLRKLGDNFRCTHESKCRALMAVCQRRIRVGSFAGPLPSAAARDDRRKSLT